MFVTCCYNLSSIHVFALFSFHFHGKILQINDALLSRSSTFSAFHFNTNIFSLLHTRRCHYSTCAGMLSPWKFSKGEKKSMQIQISRDRAVVTQAYITRDTLQWKARAWQEVYNRSLLHYINQRSFVRNWKKNYGVFQKFLYTFSRGQKIDAATSRWALFCRNILKVLDIPYRDSLSGTPPPLCYGDIAYAKAMIEFLLGFI